MTSRLRNTALVVLSVATGLGLVIAGSTVRHAYADTHPKRVKVSPEQAALARTRLPGLKDVQFRTRDDLVLHGWFSPGPRKDAVVLVHGLGGNRFSLLPEAESLAAHGHGVFLYDSRASGDSDGIVATWGDRERLDIAAALDLLVARSEVDPARIGIYGFSVGASAVALASAENPRIRAVLLGPIWPSLETELEDKFKRWGPLSAWVARRTFEASGVDVQAIDALKAVSAIPPRPLMLLSGSADDDTPPSIMAKVNAAVPSAEWWLVPGAGHGDYSKVAPAEYGRRFAGFFDKSL